MMRCITGVQVEAMHWGTTQGLDNVGNIAGWTVDQSQVWTNFVASAKVRHVLTFGRDQSSHNLYMVAAHVSETSV